MLFRAHAAAAWLTAILAGCIYWPPVYDGGDPGQRIDKLLRLKTASLDELEKAW